MASIHPLQPSGGGVRKQGKGIPIEVPTTARRLSNFSLHTSNPNLLTGSRDGGSIKRRSSTSSHHSNSFSVVGEIGSPSRQATDRGKKQTDIVLLSDEDEQKGLLVGAMKRRKTSVSSKSMLTPPTDQITSSTSVVSRMKKHLASSSTSLPSSGPLSKTESNLIASSELIPVAPAKIAASSVAPEQSITSVPSSRENIPLPPGSLSEKVLRLGMGTFPQASIKSVRLGSRVELTSPGMMIQFGPDRLILTIDKNITKISHENIKCVEYNMNGKPIIFALQTKESLPPESALEPYYDPDPGLLSGKARKIVLISDADAQDFVECCRRLERKKIPMRELPLDIVEKILVGHNKRHMTKEPSSSAMIPAKAQGQKKSADETLFMFPFKSSTKSKSIAVRVDDMSRLNDDEFLNDTLIEFGLKYIHASVENENRELADATYIFNSFFYERLVTKSGKGINYESVRSWTNKIDIFSKKFIIIPIHENVHWYLAIISNPGLLLSTENRIDTDADIDTTLNRKDETLTSLSSSPSSLSISETLSTTSGEAMRTNLLQDISFLASPRNRAKLRVDDEREQAERLPRSSAAAWVDPEKKPFIIVLDSLGSSHPSVFRSLRLYLQQELLTRKNIDRAIDSKDVPGKLAKCPQQENFCDCGLFLLHYAEVFLKHPDALLNGILNKSDDMSNYWAVGDLMLKREKYRQIMISLAEQYKAYLFSQQQIEKIKESGLHRAI
ncbi:hypothetical protein BCR41DRAFT_357046 [Lobosporangium transversale]|uniref:Ubiquitin-like protease family profile domain-containing protein n=1 Tax=Lobosporangium transversale TaxID=64571 RepID=A0A1Y2GJB8_9FUNG|nr:hypothetical protein BCR41DRAFT_357046 [Lobosporangium transversale]ORZ11332.1 hypothetical protein BCR41DRAFT_357046 [Lobosporangium transversale]|eukprot:XP_021879647.1 hypothetical protein BCR41DRAFT_357046 [Lobosporangium transversale]